MTPIGHSLVGATIGILCAARLESWRSRIAIVTGMVVLANVPDLPFPGWGHDRYEISHSLPLGIFLALVLVLVVRLSRLRLTYVGSWSFVTSSLLALCSHYLLDSFYNHGKGIAIFWPLSDARLALPIPWFATMKTDPLLCWHNFKTWGIEFLCYGTLSLLILVIAFRKPSKPISEISDQETR